MYKDGRRAERVKWTLIKYLLQGSHRSLKYLKVPEIDHTFFKAIVFGKRPGKILEFDSTGSH